MEVLSDMAIYSALLNLLALASHFDYLLILHCARNTTEIYNTNPSTLHMMPLIAQRY
jgi:hypothetical protein